MPGIDLYPIQYAGCLPCVAPSVTPHFLRPCINAMLLCLQFDEAEMLALGTMENGWGSGAPRFEPPSRGGADVSPGGVPASIGASRKAPNKSADVWAVGCLLYELLTGEFLFQEREWPLFYLRVTSTTQPLLTPAKRQILREVVPEVIQSPFTPVAATNSLHHPTAPRTPPWPL